MMTETELKNTNKVKEEVQLNTI